MRIEREVTYQSCPPRMILGAPTSFASAAMSSDARLSPYKLMGFGGTLGASWEVYQSLTFLAMDGMRRRDEEKRRREIDYLPSPHTPSYPAPQP